jgi:hypothetical protein
MAYKQIINKNLPSKVDVTSLGALILEDIIAVIKGEIRQMESNFSNEGHIDTDNYDNLNNQLRTEVSNSRDQMHKYELTLDRLNIVSVDETKPLKNVELGSYVILEFNDDQSINAQNDDDQTFKRYVITGLSDGGKGLCNVSSIGRYTLTRGDSPLGQAILDGGLTEGSQVNPITKIAEIGWGESTYTLERELGIKYNDLKNMNESYGRTGQHAYLEMLGDFKGDTLIAIDEQKLAIRKGFRKIQGSDGPSLSDYENATKGERIKMRLSIEPENRHYLRTYALLNHFERKIGNL